MWGETVDIIATYETAVTDNFAAVRKEAVRLAGLELLKDTREIGANNRGPVVDIYLRNANALEKVTDPTIEGKGWCGMFIYYCYSQAAKSFGKILPFHSGNFWNGHNLKKWSLIHAEKIVAQLPVLPGDIYIMNDFHMGMVVEVIKEDLYKTIDGNQTGGNAGTNSVKNVVRSLYDMQLLIRI